jgi:hypothetical protein
MFGRVRLGWGAVQLDDNGDDFRLWHTCPDLSLSNSGETLPCSRWEHDGESAWPASWGEQSCSNANAGWRRQPSHAPKAGANRIRSPCGYGIYTSRRHCRLNSHISSLGAPAPREGALAQVREASGPRAENKVPSSSARRPRPADGVV